MKRIQMETRGVQFFNTHWDDDSHVIRMRIGAKAVAYSGATKEIDHWIGLRENLQETMVFTIKYRAFL